MPPNLHGLNIVHPVQPTQDAHDLLAAHAYPDLSAQLDLWTHLAFDSDDSPLASKQENPANNDNNSGVGNHRLDDEDEDGKLSAARLTEAAVHDGHINVVTGTNLGSNMSPDHQHAVAHQTQHQGQPGQSPFDINAFLASFGIDPYSVPALPPQPQPAIAPSLAQLIALHSAHTQPYLPPPLPALHQPQPQQPSLAARPSQTSSASRSAEEPTSAKRARTRKASVSTAIASSAADSVGNTSVDGAAAAPAPPPRPTTPITAAEDKRRRNTAASARFRLKKKEREAALEGKAKELENRVNELERECEGLRRENGWLKGLVVGVTGAAQQVPVSNTAVAAAAASVSPSPSGVGVGTKRSREEPESA